MPHGVPPDGDQLDQSREEIHGLARYDDTTPQRVEPLQGASHSTESDGGKDGWPTHLPPRRDNASCASSVQNPQRSQGYRKEPRSSSEETPRKGESSRSILFAKEEGKELEKYGQEPMEKRHKNGQDPGRSQGSPQRSLERSVVISSNTLVAIESPTRISPPDSEVPPEALDNVRDFFNQILIKNIGHIDTKINEIRAITAHNHSNVQQFSKVISEKIEPHVKEIKQAQSVQTFDSKQLHKFITATVDAKLNELNLVNLQNRNELKFMTKSIPIAEKEINEIKNDSKRLVDIEKLLWDIKNKMTQKVEPQPAQTSNSEKQYENLMAEINQVRHELITKVHDSKASVLKEIKDTVDLLHDDNESTSVHQEVQIDNIMQVLEKTAKMEKDLKYHLDSIEDNLRNRFINMETTVKNDFSRLEILLQAQRVQTNGGNEFEETRSGSSTSHVHK